MFAKLKNVYGILDFYHAAQNVYKGAKAKFDGRTIKCKEWFEEVRKKLRLGNAAEIIQEIKKWLKIEEINRILNNGNLSDEVVRCVVSILILLVTSTIDLFIEKQQFDTMWKVLYSLPY